MKSLHIFIDTIHTLIHRLHVLEQALHKRAIDLTINGVRELLHDIDEAQDSVLRVKARVFPEEGDNATVPDAKLV
jgi:hypothetical protein